MSAPALRLSQSRVISLLAVTVVTWVVFSIFGRGFLSSFNVYSLNQVIALSIILGLAQAALMVLGRINLAVGGIGVVVVAVIGVLNNYTTLPLVVVLVVALLVGVAAGAVIAAVEIYTKLNSFVVTLAFLSIYQGGVLLITSATHYPVTDAGLVGLGSKTVLTPYLSPLLVIALVVAAVLWLFYFRTGTGWQSRAIGASERAASASGINPRRIVWIGYMLSGALCAVAAIMETARLSAASPATGSDWLLLSFIGPLLAGVALSGGTISVGGIILGSVFYGSIFSGLIILQVPTYWLTFSQALVLLLALVVGELGRRAQGRLATKQVIL